ncbi:MAG: DUF58 domain-containing protein [Acidilobaceae archaeon]|nr:DUF58 domain-containing protein [Acidilobaceae archaeon]
MITSSTQRALALVLLASLAITADLFGLAPAGRIGVTAVLVMIALKLYATVAQASLESLRVSSRHEGALEGRPLRVSYEICNPTYVPLAFVELSLNYPEYLRLSEGSSALIAGIPPKGCMTYSVSFAARVGEHEIGPLRALFRDPFGIFRGREITIGEKTVVRVKPRESEKLRRFLLSLSRGAGMVRTGKAGEGLEFLATRDYMPGDDLKRIFWRALAKGRLAVKEFDRESTQYNVLLLAVSRDMLAGPYLQTPFEHAARIIASLSRYFADRGEHQSFYLVGSRRVEGTRMARGRRGYEAVMRAISRVKLSSMLEEEGFSADGRLSRALLGSLPRERVNLIAIATANNAIQLAEELKALASSSRCSVYLLLLLPQLYGIESVSPMERAVFRIKSFQEIMAVKGAIKEIKKRGIKAIALAPSDMARKIVRKLAMERV